MSNQEIRYLIKNEIQYLKFKNPKKHFNYFYIKYKDIIDKDIIFLNKDVTIQEKLYCFINNISFIPKCLFCKTEIVKFKDFKSGYRIFCSKACTSRASVDKIKEIFLKKYNGHPAKTTEIKEKRKKTNLLKYGVENASSSDIIKERRKNTNLSRYNAESPLESKEIQEKIKESCMKNLGVEYPFQSQKIQKIIQDNNIKKYGVNSNFKRQEILELIKEINIKRYGVDNYFKIYSNKITNEEIIERSNNKFNGMYTLEFLSENDGLNSLININCPIHGEVLTTAGRHLDLISGCPECKVISAGEHLIKNFLLANNIEFKQQKTFKGCKHKTRLQFDFYLLKYNICIEYDGPQHFKFIEYFHKNKDEFKIRQKCDKIKDEYCRKNNIHLLRISYLEKDNIEKILSDFINSTLTT